MSDDGGMTGGPTELDRVRALREVLTATGAGIYLCTHAAGPIPAETMAALHESDELELRVGRFGPGRADDLEQRDKEARAVAAAAIKASPDRVVLAHGLAEATRLVCLEVLGRGRHSSGPDGPADPPRALVVEGATRMVEEAVRAVAVAVGAVVETVPEAPRIIAADVALVVLAHVDDDGRLGPVAAAAAAAHGAGALLLLDASLSAGAIAVDVAELDADVLIAAADRWLLGPEGMALAWFAPGLDVELPQRMRASVDPFGRGSLLALSRSLGWLLMYVELPWAVSRTRLLSDQLASSLTAIEGVTVATAGFEHAALHAFAIDGWSAEQAADELSRSVFAIVDVDERRDLLRVSVGAWNREDELERFADRVTELAAHTPDSLPRRPSLTVIDGAPGPRADR